MKALLFFALCILLLVSYSSACKCARVYKPVCYQGVTYSNSCMLLCSRITQGRSAVDYNKVIQGPCNMVDETASVRPSRLSRVQKCRCTSNYAPVCVSGSTFSNFCAARCKFGEDLDLMTVNSGACDSLKSNNLEADVLADNEEESEYSCNAGQTYIPGKGCVNCYVYPSMCKGK